MAEEGSIEVAVEKATGSVWASQTDRVAIEEPLEIRLGYVLDGKRIARSISITMRTPGDDESLAIGFLLSEGILRAPSDVQQVRVCGRLAEQLRTQNVVCVELRQ